MDAYRHVPSNNVSPIDNAVVTALTNVPKVPQKFDRRNADVMGINEDLRGKDGKPKKGFVFSKFMLDRLKKHSILNHEVFKRDGIDYKKQVANNYLKYQKIIRREGAN